VAKKADTAVSFVASTGNDVGTPEAVKPVAVAT
jgi:hypothetical protein